jgi:hypothetical protein
MAHGQQSIKTAVKTTNKHVNAQPPLLQCVNSDDTATTVRNPVSVEQQSPLPCYAFLSISLSFLTYFVV